MFQDSLFCQYDRRNSYLFNFFLKKNMQWKVPSNLYNIDEDDDVFQFVLLGWYWTT